jgi:hypothetical protein
VAGTFRLETATAAGFSGALAGEAVDSVALRRDIGRRSRASRTSLPLRHLASGAFWRAGGGTPRLADVERVLAPGSARGEPAEPKPRPPAAFLGRRAARPSIPPPPAARPPDWPAPTRDDSIARPARASPPSNARAAPGGARGGDAPSRSRNRASGGPRGRRRRFHRLPPRDRGIRPRAPCAREPHIGRCGRASHTGPLARNLDSGALHRVLVRWRAAAIPSTLLTTVCPLSTVAGHRVRVVKVLPSSRCTSTAGPTSCRGFHRSSLLGELGQTLRFRPDDFAHVIEPSFAHLFAHPRRFTPCPVLGNHANVGRVKGICAVCGRVQSCRDA